MSHDEQQTEDIAPSGWRDVTALVEGGVASQKHWRLFTMTVFLRDASRYPKPYEYMVTAGAGEKLESLDGGFARSLQQAKYRADQAAADYLELLYEAQERVARGSRMAFLRVEAELQGVDR